MKLRSWDGNRPASSETVGTSARLLTASVALLICRKSTVPAAAPTRRAEINPVPFAAKAMSYTPLLPAPAATVTLDAIPLDRFTLNNFDTEFSPTYSAEPSGVMSSPLSGPPTMLVKSVSVAPLFAL